VVQGKESGAEAVGKNAGAAASQIGEQKTPKEEFFQKRVDKGNIQGNIQEVMLVDACIGGQLVGNTGEVIIRPHQKVPTKDYAVNTGAEKQRRDHAFLFKAKQFPIPDFPVEKGYHDRHQQEKRQLDAGFDCIAGPDDAVNQRHNAAANHSGSHNQENGPFFHTDTSFEKV